MTFIAIILAFALGMSAVAVLTGKGESKQTKKADPGVKLKDKMLTAIKIALLDNDRIIKSGLSTLGTPPAGLAQHNDEASKKARRSTPEAISINDAADITFTIREGQVEKAQYDGQGDKDISANIPLYGPKVLGDLCKTITGKDYNIAKIVSKKDGLITFVLRKMNAEEATIANNQALAVALKISAGVPVFELQPDGNLLVKRNGCVELTSALLQKGLQPLSAAFNKFFYDVRPKDGQEWLIVAAPTLEKYKEIQALREEMDKAKFYSDSVGMRIYPEVELSETLPVLNIYFQQENAPDDGSVRDFIIAAGRKLHIYPNVLNYKVDVEAGVISVDLIDEAQFKNNITLVDFCKNAGFFLLGIDSEKGRVFYPRIVQDPDTKDVCIYPDRVLLNTEQITRKIPDFNTSYRADFDHVKSCEGEDGELYFKVVTAHKHQQIFKKGTILTNREAWEKNFIAPMRAQDRLAGEPELWPLGQALDKKYRKGDIILYPFTNLAHGICTGTSGTGKTATMRSFITTTAYAYPDIQWYFADGKSGEDWSTCARFLSTRPVAMQSPVTGDMLIHLANVLSEVFSIFQARQAEFRKISQESGVDINNIYLYRKTTQKLMPQIILVIDEFPVFNMELDFNNTFQIQGTMSNMLKRLLAESRSFGIHVLLVVQDYKVTSVPKEARSQLKLQIHHSCIEKDRDFVGIPDELNLGTGEYCLMTEGEVKDHDTGCSKVYTKHLFAGDDMSELYTQLFPKIPAANLDKRPFDENFVYLKRGSEALEKMTLPERFTLTCVKVFYQNGWGYQRFTIKDPTSIPVAGLVTSPDGKRKIAIAFTRLSILETNAEVVLSSAQEQADTLGANDIIYLIDKKLPAKGGIVNDFIGMKNVMFIAEGEYLPVLAYEDTSAVLASWMKRLDLSATSPEQDPTGQSAPKSKTEVGDAFEDLTERVLAVNGFKVVGNGTKKNLLNKKIGDGGIDAWAEKNGHIYVISCKNWSKNGEKGLPTVDEVRIIGFKATGSKDSSPALCRRLGLQVWDNSRRIPVLATSQGATGPALDEARQDGIVVLRIDQTGMVPLANGDLLNLPPIEVPISPEAISDEDIAGLEATEALAAKVVSTQPMEPTAPVSAPSAAPVTVIRRPGAAKDDRKKDGDLWECGACKEMKHKSEYILGRGKPQKFCQKCRDSGE